jgi:hypothetical protein
MTQPHQLQQLASLPMSEELPKDTTAVVLHWPQCEGPKCQADRVFIFSGMYGGEALHRRIDALIEEHTPRAYGANNAALTEVTVFWHMPNGKWEMEEFESRLYD